MTDELLGDRVYRLLDTTDRGKPLTPKEIAAALETDEYAVTVALRTLEITGRVKAEPRKGGLETYRTGNTAGAPSAGQQRRPWWKRWKWPGFWLKPGSGTGG